MKIILKVCDYMTENIDVKKIMKAIRDKSAQKKESTINDKIIPLTIIIIVFGIVAAYLLNTN